MRAIAFDRFGDEDVLKKVDHPIPEAGPGEIVIKVRAAGVNPVDWKIREGYLRDLLPHELPVVPGWDVSGFVEATGPGAVRFKPGDEVFAYCRKPLVKHGSYCEFMTIPEQIVARKPRTIGFEEAASVPLAALTAYQSLFDIGCLQRGETVLVHAASGGVGTFAVQLAKDAGAIVVGTCGTDNLAYVKSLGADEVVDYTREDFREKLKDLFPAGIEMVLDCVGGKVLEQSQDVLRDGGRLISIVDHTFPGKLRQSVSFQFVFVQPDAAQLKTIGDMVEENRLRPHVSAVLQLEDAKRAHALSRAGHVRGKLVLKIS